ncbi:MAG: diphosphomevalonate decarboxylase [Haliscomenobacter sp.]|nr:diphosphomevalonate decarboxylase [Haliscomenobacter sp.]
MPDYKSQHLLPDGRAVEGRVRWQSPSNIAIVKYWGKHGKQLPRNPSISFTLQNAVTDTTLRYQPKEKAKGISLRFTFEGSPRPAFSQKIEQFLEQNLWAFPFLEQLDIQIDSSNTFPHSAGIASSASSMSALALCLCSLERELFGTLADERAFFQKASYFARLGSGSACRSVYPYAALWGQSPSFPKASDEFAIPIGKTLHPVFQGFHDDILIVSKKEKPVSSRVGHQLMEGNPYASSRYQQAHDHTSALAGALEIGDVEIFGQIAESEALTLHALMMASSPPFILMQPHSLALIDRIRQYRSDTRLPLYFTLDAGPNLHLLYPDECREEIQSFIRTELTAYCEDGFWIQDQVGSGPKQIRD